MGGRGWERRLHREGRREDGGGRREEGGGVGKEDCISNFPYDSETLSSPILRSTSCRHLTASDTFWSSIPKLLQARAIDLGGGGGRPQQVL